MPRIPFVPTRPVACTWREVLRVCLGVFVGRGKERGGGLASRGRHSQSQAEAHPQLSPAPRGATCSVRFGSALTARALFRSACAACKIWPRVFVASSSAVSTDDKFKAKWLLETSLLAGGALGPREGHMTRLAARAAGAGKGEGGRRERRGQSRAVDCAVLWVSSAFRCGQIACFYSSHFEAWQTSARSCVVW